jgi:hypothetical protein
MLYKVRNDHDVFEDNPELHAIPEFSKLSDRQMKLVILYSDLGSPLSTLSDKDRREQCWKVVGGPFEANRPDRNGRNFISKEVKSVEDAIIRYRELQYDEDRDTLDTTIALIQTNKNYIKSINEEKDQTKKDYGKDLERANKLAKELPELLETRNKIRDLLGVRQTKPVEIETGTVADISQELLEGDEPLSTLDMVMMSKKKSKQNGD